MRPEPTPEALIQLLRRYYPAGLEHWDPRYATSEEAQRLDQLLRAARQDSSAWAGFLQRLRAELPQCRILEMTNLWHDPCYTCRVWLPGVEVGGDRFDAVVCLLSLLAPVYALYGCHARLDGPSAEWAPRLSAFPQELQPHEARLATLIETTFGATRLSEDVLSTPIPELVPRSGSLELGQAKLIDCLFTDHRWCG
jgi:hypothetical protein